MVALDKRTAVPLIDCGLILQSRDKQDGEPMGGIEVRPF